MSDSLSGDDFQIINDANQIADYMDYLCYIPVCRWKMRPDTVSFPNQALFWHRTYILMRIKWRKASAAVVAVGAQ